MDVSGLQNWLLENTDQTVDDIPQKHLPLLHELWQRTVALEKEAAAAANQLRFMQSSLTAMQEPVIIACSSDFQVKHISANHESVLGIERDTVQENFWNIYSTSPFMDMAFCKTKMGSISLGQAISMFTYRTHPATQTLRQYEESIYHVPMEGILSLKRGA